MFFKRNHPAAVTRALGELLQRNPPGLETSRWFWVAYGPEILDVWVDMTDEYWPSSGREAQALARLRAEVGAIANALRDFPEPLFDLANADCQRSLAFCGITSYQAQTGVTLSFDDFWRTYERVLANRRVTPRTNQIDVQHR